ncbi:MAG: DUF3800 domain-containing protein [Candidatus Levybacteria bacterium]|nr:DUF3800 domain-containing protein [Candidatus Levybacteria bacterium]MBI3070143.1 DUF3800 domain-containing protein [Candidatus Levybacteria bacterium]MBI3092836.1 DUF3800 domain-containing protein [Candidatus Levybacteria bacterium]
MQSDTQYIFFDESGKPEVFSAKGENLVLKGFATKFLILVAIRTENQLVLQQQVVDFRSLLLKEPTLMAIFSAAYTLDSFHAQTDYLQVKEKFYQFITTLDIKIDVLIVDKLKCYETLQRNPGRLYGVMAGQLLKNLVHQKPNTEIIFSRKDSKLKLRQELEIEVERVRLDYIQNHPKLQSNVSLHYYHNPHYSHGGLQVADYISHAVFQVYENNKRDFYEIVKNKIGKIQDICNKKYFTRSNLL